MAEKKREYTPDVGSIEAPQYPGLEDYFVDPVQKLSKNPVGQFIAPTALAEYLHKLNYGDPISAGDRGLAALDSTLLDKPAAIGLGALAKGAGALKGVAAAALPYRFKASKLAEELWGTPVVEEAAAWGTGGASGIVPYPYAHYYDSEGNRLYVPISEVEKRHAATDTALFRTEYDKIEDDFLNRWSKLYREKPLPFRTGEPLTIRGFHGSKRADIERFKKKMLGKNTNAKSAELGTFIAGSPYNANNYAKTHWHGNDHDLESYIADDRYGRRLDQALYPDHIPSFERSPAYKKLYNQWLLEKDNSGLPILSRAASKNPDDPRFYREYMDQEFKPSSDYRFNEEGQYAFDDYIKRKSYKLDHTAYMPNPVKISQDAIDRNSLYFYNINNDSMPSELSENAASDLYYAFKNDYKLNAQRSGASEHEINRAAEDYAKRQMEYIKRKQQEFKNANSKSAKEFEDFLRRADVRLPEYGSSIYPVYTHFENPLVRDWDRGNYREHSFSKFIEQAIDEGHDGAILANASDPDLDNIFVQFKPHRIRSQFAKFDKSKRKSDDITKAKGGMIERTTRDRKIL